jgi:hypothetical protein
MALLFMDGFLLGDAASRWVTSGGTIAVGTASPRITAGSYLYNSGLGTALTLIRGFTASAEIFMGYGFRVSAHNTSNYVAFFGDSGATQHLTLVTNATGVLELRRGTTSGTVLATGTTNVADDAWRHFEVHATIADSGGVFQLRLNGSASYEINYSGDTKNAGTATNVDAVKFSLYVNNAMKISDVFILNAAGDAPTSWLGDKAIRTLTPNGNGDASQWVGSDSNSTNNYLLVNDAPLDVADYVGASTNGYQDLYTLSNLPVGVTGVTAVALNLYAAKTDAGAMAIKPLLRSGGTDYAGTAVAQPTTPATMQAIYAVDPATSAAWATSAVDALEAGAEVSV